MTQKTKSRWLKKVSLSLLGVVCILFTLLGTSMTLRWKLLHQLLASKFSDTPVITTEQLAEWLRRPEKIRPILLDAREPSEYNISHIQSAQLTPPNTTTETLKQRYKPDALIVVYCSIGYRSSSMVQRLKQAGFQNVYNLKGSIFQWANEGKPLYHNEKTTTRVHPFNWLWGNFLDKRYHAKTK